MSRFPVVFVYIEAQQGEIINPFQHIIRTELNVLVKVFCRDRLGVSHVALKSRYISEDRELSHCVTDIPPPSPYKLTSMTLVVNEQLIPFILSVELILIKIISSGRIKIYKAR